jgi:hypothetical protein
MQFVEKQAGFVDYCGVVVGGFPSPIKDLAENRPAIHGFSALPVPCQIGDWPAAMPAATKSERKLIQACQNMH